MIFLVSLRPFFARYFPVFMAVVYAGIIGATATVSLAGRTYFRTMPLELAAPAEFWTCIALSLVITTSHLMMVYGRSGWVWVMVAFFVICLLTTLPMVRFSPNKFLYAESLFWPLLGLLILNSKRHREMRGLFIDLRYRRQRLRQLLSGRQGRHSHSG